MITGSWATSALLLTWTFATVYCDEVEVSERASLFENIVGSMGPDVMITLAMEYANTSNPSEVGYKVKRSSAAMSSVQYSVDCGIQNSEERFRKICTHPDSGGRIIGGTDTDPGEFPWQISLQDRSLDTPFRHKCGGSIISENIVVTAGHCVAGISAEQLQVVAGVDDIWNPTGNEQKRRVKTYINKFYMIWETPVDDIAVLVLDEPFKFDSRVAPVCLPNADFVYDGVQGIVTGWGQVSEEGERARILQVVQIPIVPRDKCREKYERQDRGQGIKECNICAGSNIGGRDSCQGDSGGPMTCVEDDGRHYLCGVVSWGIGCGHADSPGVYTFTPCYSDWIQQQIATYNSTA